MGDMFKKIQDIEKNFRTLTPQARTITLRLLTRANVEERTAVARKAKGKRKYTKRKIVDEPILVDRSG
jgi:hypothetical protein